jgi:6-phosphofructokinase 1
LGLGASGNCGRQPCKGDRSTLDDLAMMTGQQGSVSSKPTAMTERRELTMSKKVFLSFCFDDKAFVEQVNAFLVKQPDIKTFFYPLEKNGQAWADAVETYLTECDSFVLFVGERVGQTEIAEAIKAQQRADIDSLMVVRLPAAQGSLSDSLSVQLSKFLRIDPICVAASCDVEKCARDIVARLRVRWDVLGIPETYPFEYEKDIVAAYRRADGRVPDELAAQGCPEKWPDVPRKRGRRENPVPPIVIGDYRDCDEKGNDNKDPRVIVAALSDYHGQACQGCPLDSGLTFAEAGPRKWHVFPKRGSDLKVGILVSGGIAPGLNAVIAGIMARHILYFDALKSDAGTLTFHCYREGFNSLSRHRGAGPDYQLFSLTKVPGMTDDRQKLREMCQHAYGGGSIIPTSRTPELMASDALTRRAAFENIVSALNGDGIDLLYVIGGEGSMRAAHAIQNCADEKQVDLTVVGVPKTMDNDILWVWQSFGFPSAVEWAKDAISHLHTEATSNPRLCVIQLFGSDSGFVVCHAALSTGVCDLALIPEVDFDVENLVKYIKDTLRPRHARGINGRSPYSILLMSETAIPMTMNKTGDPGVPGFVLDDPDYHLAEREKEAVVRFFEEGRRVQGQTPDELRRAGLKIVVGAAEKAIRELAKTDPYWEDFRVFTNEPRHLLRAIPPSSSDILFARRLGSLAVDGAMAGYRDFMISQWLTEYVMVPLSLVVLGRKRVPKKGIFWRSVLASTGQPGNMGAVQVLT